MSRLIVLGSIVFLYNLETDTEHFVYDQFTMQFIVSFIPTVIDNINFIITESANSNYLHMYIHFSGGGED